MDERGRVYFDVPREMTALFELRLKVNKLEDPLKIEKKLFQVYYYVSESSIFLAT